MSRTRSKALFGSLFIILLIVGGTVSVLLLPERDPYFSAPDQIRAARSARDWDPVMSPPAGYNPSRPYNFAKVTAKETGGNLEIHGDITSVTDGAIPDIKVVDAGASDSATIDGMTIRIKGMAMLWPDEEFLRTKSNSNVPAKFVHPITHDPIEVSIIGDSTPTFYTSRVFWPTLKVAIETSDYSEFHWMGVHLLNEHTQTSLISGYSYSHAQMTDMTMNMKAWHNPPLVIAVDFAYGPAEYHPYPNAPGQPLSFSQVDVKPLDLLVGPWTNAGRSYSSTEVNYRYRPDSRGRVGQVGALSYAPEELGKQLHLVLDENLVTHLNASHGVGSWSNPRVSTTETTGYRFRFLPNRGRVIFHLPPPPGGPHENKPPDNLFSTTVPYLEVESSYDLKDWVESLTLLQFGPSFPYTGSSKPKDTEFTDVTAQELLEAYMDMAGVSRVEIDPTTHTISTSVPWWKRFADWLGL